MSKMRIILCFLSAVALNAATIVNRGLPDAGTVNNIAGVNRPVLVL